MFRALLIKFVLQVIVLVEKSAHVGKKYVLKMLSCWKSIGKKENFEKIFKLRIFTYLPFQCKDILL